MSCDVVKMPPRSSTSEYQSFWFMKVTYLIIEQNKGPFYQEKKKNKIKAQPWLPSLKLEEEKGSITFLSLKIQINYI